MSTNGVLEGVLSYIKFLQHFQNDSSLSQPARTRDSGTKTPPELFKVSHLVIGPQSSFERNLAVQNPQHYDR